MLVFSLCICTLRILWCLWTEAIGTKERKKETEKPDRRKSRIVLFAGKSFNVCVYCVQRDKSKICEHVFKSSVCVEDSKEDMAKIPYDNDWIAYEELVGHLVGISSISTCDDRWTLSCITLNNVWHCFVCFLITSSHYEYNRSSHVLAKLLLVWSPFGVIFLHLPYLPELICFLDNSIFRIALFCIIYSVPENNARKTLQK